MKADRADDKEFWGPIHAALDDKGPANFLNFLLNLEYDREVLFRPPMTTAKALWRKSLKTSFSRY